MPYKNIEDQKKWRERHKEERSLFRKENKSFIDAQDRRYGLKNKYGITPEEYNKLFEEQEGKCKTCGIHQTELKYRLCVDHNHKTGEVRGLLCSHCNLCIGHSKENIETLSKIILYLGDK